MKKLFWVLAILSIGIVGHFDSPSAHIEAAIDNSEIPCHTTLDQYQAVTLNAIGRGK